MTIAEYTAIREQTVPIGQNIAFLEEAVEPCGCRITHRTGAGIVGLRGHGRYLVTFGANVASDTADAQIEFAIAVDGEPIESAVMQTSSPVADIYSNISASIVIDVPCGCCYTVAVENSGAIEATVQNANIIIEKVED